MNRSSSALLIALLCSITLNSGCAAPTQPPIPESTVVPRIAPPTAPFASLQSSTATAPATNEASSPTPILVRVDPGYVSSVRPAIKEQVNSEVAKIDGIQSAQVTAQLEGDQYQAIGEATIKKDGKDKTVNFLIKPDGSLLILGDKVDQLEWAFDLSGAAVWKDKPGNVFGTVVQAKDYKDWTVAINGYGIVGIGGLPVAGASFAEGQPLLARVTKDNNGNIVGISVMVKPPSSSGSRFFPGNYPTVRRCL